MPRVRPVAGQEASSASRPLQAETSGPDPGLAVSTSEVCEVPEVEEGSQEMEPSTAASRLQDRAPKTGDKRKERSKKEKKDKHGKKRKKEKEKKMRKAREEEEQPRSIQAAQAFDLDELLAGSDLFNAEVEANSDRPNSEEADMLPVIPDAALDQQRKIEKILAGAGGELRLGTVEQLLNTQLHKQALTGFAISPSADGDRRKDLVRLTAKQACNLLEGPSLQMAYLEDRYFALGDAVLQAGLDFDNEEKFRNTFEDFLAKREEVRMAAQRNSFIPYVPRTRAAKRSRKDLPPMTQFEKNLLQDIQRVLKARQASQSWISLSELLEDPVIRRARCKLPRGLALWEWLSLRCGDRGGDGAEITMVNERSDMLLQMVTASGPADALHMTLEERKQELSLAVFETLAILQRNFPDGGGLSLEDLQQVPAVARLQFGRPALQQALSRMKTVKVFARADGQQMVQLRPAAEVLGKEGAGRASSAQETKESEKSKSDKLAAKDAATNSQPKSTRPSSLSSSATTRQAMSQGQQQLPDRVPVTVEGWRRVQDQFFKGWPPLPDGWIRVISRSTGKVFFVDQHGGGVGQMELPQDAAATAQSAS